MDRNRITTDLLHHGPDLFRLLLESTADTAIYILDTQGRIASWNSGAERILGYQPEEVLGQPFSMLFSPADVAAGKPARDLGAALRAGRYREEGHQPRRDGSEFWAVSTMTTLQEGGRHIGYAVVINDLTERKRYEDTLLESERRLQTALKAGQMGAWEWDMDANRSVCTDVEYQLFGIEPGAEPISTEEFFSRVHPDDQERVRATAALATPGGEPLHVEFRIVLPDGKVRWLEGVGHMSLDQRTGAVRHMFGVNFDITDRKEQEESLRRSELRYRSLIEAWQGTLWISSPDGQLKRSSGFWNELVGVDREAALDPDWPQHIHPDDRERLLETWAANVRAGRLHEARCRVITGDGNIVHLHNRAVPVRAEDGSILEWVGVTTDVTASVEADQRLRESEESLRILVNGVADQAMFLTGPDGAVATWNEGARRIFGYDEPDIVGRPYTTLYASERDGEDDVAAHFAEARRLGRSEVEVWGLRNDGTRVRARVSLTTLHGADRQVRGYAHIVRDLSENFRVSRQLSEAESRLRAILDTDVVPICNWRADGRITEANAAFLRITGYSEAELMAGEIHLEKLTPPEDERLDRAAWVEIDQTGRCKPYERDLLRKDGTAVPVLIAAGALRGENSAVAFALDMTDMRRAREALLLRDRAIQAVSQGILITDSTAPDEPLIYVSPAFESITGYTGTDVLGKNCRFLQGPGTDPETVKLLHDSLSAGAECNVEILNYRKDGTPFWNALFITPVHDAHDKRLHFVGVQADITERKRLEEALQQSQKMEAIGRLAGGVAHDFNNLLTVISGFSDMLLEEMQEPDSNRELVVQIREAGERASSLTRQLLAFSRRQVVDPQVIDINRIVEQSEKMLGRIIGEDVVLTVNLDSGLPLVKADPMQVDQVLLNLCVNARDAMPDGGRLTIQTSRLDVAPGERPYLGLPAGTYAQLSVTDTGTGIPPELRQRIFEPFFTTKEQGKGTGLGLSVVLGIVQQAGGEISVYSEVGMGTTFRVLLPGITGAAERSRPVDDRRSLRGNETILLVEDDDAVRRVARLALQSQGYKILEAEGGREAMELANRYADRIDLMITDVVMPEINGKQLAALMHEQLPTLKIVFMSGYSDDLVIKDRIIGPDDYFIQKPFTPRTLAQCVRDVLDGG